MLAGRKGDLIESQHMWQGWCKSNMSEREASPALLTFQCTFFSLMPENSRFSINCKAPWKKLGFISEGRTSAESASERPFGDRRSSGAFLN